MSYCMNCGQENKEGSAFCENCGRPLAQVSHSKGNENKPVGKGKSKKPFLFISLALAAAVIGSVIFIYFSAKASYDRGMIEIEAGNWEKAHDNMSRAKKTGIVFFSNSLDVYESRFNEYCEDQLKDIKKYIEDEDYNMAKQAIEEFPVNPSFDEDLEKVGEKIDKQADEELAGIQQSIAAGDYTQAKIDLDSFKKAFSFAPYKRKAEDTAALIDENPEAVAAAASQGTESGSDGTEDTIAEAAEAEQDTLSYELLQSPIPDLPATYDGWEVSSSSYLQENDTSHLPDNATDFLPSTAWVEGVDGNGAGEWLLFESEHEVPVSIISIVNGYNKSQDLYLENNRPKKIRIEFSDGSSVEPELNDSYMQMQTVALDYPVMTKSIRITILDTYPGSKYDDTCISDIYAPLADSTGD